MAFESFIAKRYLRSRRRENFISFTALISIITIALGVLVLDFVLAMMNGFENEVRGRIIDTAAHVNVYSYGGDGFAEWETVADIIESVPEVVATAPNIINKTVISSESSNDGIMVKGVILSEEVKVSKLAENILAGDLTFGADPDSLPGILLGRQLASSLGVAIDDEVVLASLKSKRRTLVLQPKYKKFQVTGIFETGLNEYDASLAYISLEAAQNLFNMDNLVGGIQVKVDDFYRSRQVAEEIAEDLPPNFMAIDWSQRHKSLFYWMTLEKLGLAIVVGLIVTIAAVNIVSTLIMLVMEKRRDVAILKAMGATRRQVMRIFMIQGTTLGLAGAVIGSILGYLACWSQQTFAIVSIPGEIYFISVLPIEIRIIEFVIVAGVSVAISFLATIYPSRRAASLFPVDILRLG